MKRKWYLKVVIFMEGVFNFEFFMSFSMGIKLDILIGAFVGVKYARFNSGASVIGLLVSLAVIGYYGVLTVLITMKVLGV